MFDMKSKVENIQKENDNLKLEMTNIKRNLGKVIENVVGTTTGGL